MSDISDSNLFHPIKNGFERSIMDANVWWRDEKMYNLPSIKRWSFELLLNKIKSGITPATILTGPRQIGKTTLLKQIIDTLLNEGVHPKRIFRIQFDDLPSLKKMEMPIHYLCNWYQETVLKKTFNQAAIDGEQAYIFLDEVQNLSNWAPQLKNFLDINPARVMITGSSALRISAGQDSLSGRVSTVEMGPLLLREIIEFRGLGRLSSFPKKNISDLKNISTWKDLNEYGKSFQFHRDKGFEAFSRFGSYPIGHNSSIIDWNDYYETIKESVINRAIIHDLRMGEKGKRRDENLLKEVFRLACKYIGQSPEKKFYLNELKDVLDANIGWPRISTYLQFLAGTLLFRLIEPNEIRLKKAKGTPKICLCDHILRAVWFSEIIHLDPKELSNEADGNSLSGRVAESTVGYFLRTITPEITYSPERKNEPEVDFIMTIGEQRIPIEVKYRNRIDYEDTIGLRSYIDKKINKAPFGILVTMHDHQKVEDKDIVCIPLSTLLLLK